MVTATTRGWETNSMSNCNHPHTLIPSLHTWISWRVPFDTAPSFLSILSLLMPSLLFAMERKTVSRSLQGLVQLTRLILQGIALCFCSFSVFCKGLRGEQSSSEMMLPFSVVILFYKLALLFHWFVSLPRALLLFDLFSLFPCALDPPCMCIEHMVHFVKSISPSFCKHIRYFKQSKHLTGFWLFNYLWFISLSITDSLICQANTLPCT